MSSTSSYYPDPHHGHYAQQQPRTQSAATVSRHVQQRRRNGYTLQHGGRQVRIGPVAFWIVVGTLVVMAIWSIATGTYFAFREDVLTRLIGRQAQLQFAYEDRIAELRAQVDRITSRQLLDQEQFEQKLKELLQRQATLEQRTDALSGDVVTTGSIRPTRHIAPPSPPSDMQLKPSPISDTVIFTAPPDREARLEVARTAGERDAACLARRRHRLERRPGARRRCARQGRAPADGRAHRYRGAGRRQIAPHAERARRSRRIRRAPAAAAGGVGGPFVPLKAPTASASAFDRQLYRINLARAQIDHLNHVLVAVPVRKPVAGEVDMSSPFGVRTDPFLGRPAMHTGIDLRGETGEPVHATAAGRVTIAGRDGGYGNMVEIDHGHGLATRYGHLRKST